MLIELKFTLVLLMYNEQMYSSFLRKRLKKKLYVKINIKNSLKDAKVTFIETLKLKKILLMLV